jgi:hypothetical protein
MKVNVNANYVTTVSLDLELPEGKTWDDVVEYYVKWGKLNILFKGETEYHEYDMGDDAGEIDWKRPATIDVYNPENYELIDSN